MLKVELPYPPSINHYWRRVGPKTLISREGRLFRASVVAIRERNACLIFASGIKHGKHIVRVLKAKHGIECGFVCGETPPNDRDAILARFRGESGGERILRTVGGPSCVAKNRYGLTEELPWNRRATSSRSRPASTWPSSPSRR